MQEMVLIRINISKGRLFTFENHVSVDFKKQPPNSLVHTTPPKKTKQKQKRQQFGFHAVFAFFVLFLVLLASISYKP